MADTLLTALSMKNHQPSTLLSMDSCAASHTELDRELNRQIILSRPPDINLPLSTDPSLPLHSWNPDNCDLLDVHLGSQVYQTETLLHLPKVARKCAKRLDSIWGAWVFFNFYFKPVLNDKAKGKITRDSNGISGFDKLDLQLDVFLVQHDMENMYMWVFKERPENALGKMQLRSYMNGHSRQGERLFPFSVDKGFVRSHRMQRKHYRGLSNPQCVHGIEIIRSPNLTCLSDDEKKRWMDLTGRDLNFLVPLEASDFGSWRNLPNTDFELEKHLTSKSNGNSRKLLGSGLNLSTLPLNHGNSDGMDVSPKNKKRKEFSPHGSDEDCYIPVNNPTPNRVSDMEIHHPIGSVWSSGFTGVMRNTSGPVTASKTIYEDEEGYLIVVSLPFADLQRVKVSWRNTLSCGIVKISCVSTARMPIIKRHERTFKLTDPSPEHCPPGEFIREIKLAGRIPEDAKLEAYYDETGTVLEIMVPKHRVGPEEHEVRVCLRPHLGTNDLLLT